MATVTGFTAERMLAIENSCIVDGAVVLDDLILTRRDGIDINAGNVRGPKGDKGDQGIQGLKGDQGIQGLKGDQGIQGLKGDQGIQGLKGDQGIQGLKGDQGIQGLTGPDQTPAGTITLWVGDTAPDNWLLCDGAAVSRSTYASLFSAIGTKYGVGDGSTTFNLPNLKGRTPFGLDSAQTEFDTLGESGGSKTHLHGLTTAQAAIVLAAAQPAISMRRVSTPSWAATHAITQATQAAGNAAASTAGAALIGSTDSESTLPPYQVVNFIIKTTAGITPADSALATRVGALESDYGATILSIREKTARFQQGLVGGGSRKVGDGWVSWGKFRTMATGRDDLTPVGYLNIEGPPDGTVIPVIGHPTVTSVTVAAGRVTMTSLSGYASLYYELPYGATEFTSQPSRFRLVDYLSGPIEIPPSWIMVVARNVDNGPVPQWTWGDGVRQDYWRTLSLTSPWVPYGGGWTIPAYKVTSDGSVKLRGLMKSGLANTTFATVPADLAPEGGTSATGEIFHVGAASGMARIDVRSDGTLLLQSFISGGVNAYVALYGAEWYPAGH